LTPFRDLAHEKDFTIRFWGVRGSIPCPGPDYVRYGGNTSCVEIRCGSHLIILDGGTGLRPLGNALIQSGPTDADILFTHTHLDHIVGIPFFAPLYDKRSTIRIWAGHLAPPRSIRDALAGIMVEPIFPVPIEVFGATPSYNDFRAGESFTLKPGIEIHTIPLRHPNGATGYRIDYAGRSLCYITDYEHGQDKIDPAIVQLIKNTELFIYDCTYTDEEYPSHVGWGHSTWQEGVKLADYANVDRLILFHHDPNHTDTIMAAIEQAAQAARPKTLVAREDTYLTL